MARDLNDLLAWREAVQLAVEVHSVAARCRGPGALAAADQLVRAADSVAANIAEGYGRGFGRDGARFLRVASGSAAELVSHLTIAGRCGRLPSEAVARLQARCSRVRALVHGLIRRYGRAPNRL